MARLLPARLGSRPRSDAEQRILARLERELDDQWWVLHSVGFVRHRTKRWAEADFVLVGPLGAYVLEVKGGRVGRDGGLWTFTDREGRASKHSEGPFDQAGSAAGALQAELAGNVRRGDTTRVQVGYGVVLPDCILPKSGPDIEPKILVDGTDIDQRLDRFVARLSVYWTERLGDPALTTSDIGTVVGHVRSDFEAQTSMRGVLGDVDRDLVRLTREQSRVQRELATTPRMIIAGGAGTGKTMLGIDEAIRMANDGQRVLFTCHTKALAATLHARHGHTSNLQISTWSSLQWQLLQSAGLSDRIPAEADEEARWRIFIPTLAVEAARDQSEMWDAIIVDEGQDLFRSDTLDLLDVVLRGGIHDGCWRWYMDPHQDVFDQTQHKISRRLQAATECRRSLSVNCRNTSEIASATELLSGRTMEETDVTGPDVEWLHYDPAEFGSLIASTLDDLLKLDIKPADITVLTPGSLDERTRKALSAEMGGPVVGWRTAHAEASAITHSTIRSFKGLESPVVVLTGLEHLESAAVKRLCYVGASRATSILVVALPIGESPALEHLSVQYAQRHIDRPGV